MRGRGRESGLSWDLEVRVARIAAHPVTENQVVHSDVSLRNTALLLYMYPVVLISEPMTRNFCEPAHSLHAPLHSEGSSDARCRSYF